MGTHYRGKVDTTLFVTCRLCLEEKGTYQVTPLVREQFKYCFDIDVEAYDGMPQLICENCQTVLSDYSTKKRIYIGRQNALKAQQQVRKEIELQAQQGAVSSSQQIECRENGVQSDENEATTRHSGQKRRNSRLQSTSTNTSRWSNSPSPSLGSSKLTNKKKIKKLIEDYSKALVCRFCNRLLKTRQGLTNHLNYKHSSLLSQYPSILSKNCVVKLDKIDNQPNKSGIANTVMLDTSKIISQETFSTHYILYCRNQIADINNTANVDSDINNTANVDSDSDTADEITGKVNQAKRRRLLSTDTVVLNDENKSPVVADEKHSVDKDIECIDIDDSSNGSSESPNNDNIVDVHNKGDDSDLRAMQRLVNMCYRKHLKKCETAKVDPVVLKPKILSIGRKVISKDGSFSSAGLLRFMESKNLHIKWQPATYNFIRIMTMLNDKDVTRDNEVWKKIAPERMLKTVFPEIVYSTINRVENNNPPHEAQEVNETSEKIVTSGREPTPSNMTITTEPDMILLNANPVANPKQLPKKSNVLPVITATTSLSDMLQVDSKPPPISSLAILIQNGNIQGTSTVPDTSKVSTRPLDAPTDATKEFSFMPVITSTTSLAVTTSEKEVESNDPTNDADDVQQTQPRIKVKPVSQLMSERALKSLSDHQTQNIMVSGTISETAPPVTTAAAKFGGLGDPPASDDGKIMLHTVEFPNTITDSPFRYFRNLLQVHNLILLDANMQISPSFYCLIKFKLQFLWDSVNQPVTLCLTVHCSGNMYVLGVKDPTQANNIDLNKLSAKWQWQILKTYITRDDVMNKMLATACKIGTECHENTKRFLCLLKSINYEVQIPTSGGNNSKMPVEYF